MLIDNFSFSTSFVCWLIEPFLFQDTITIEIRLPVVALASCKKDYVCECTDVPGFGTVSADFKDAKKKDAQDACDALQATYSLASPATKCSLK